MRLKKDLNNKWNLNSIKGFKKVYDEFAPKLYGLCLTGTKNQELSEDIVQEVFCKVWEKRHKIDTSLPLENYLITLAKHKMIDHFRKNKTEKNKKSTLRPIIALETTPEDLAIYNEQKSLALTVLKKFPLKTKRIFLLSRKHGMTNKEIAMELIITEKSVEYHISKALQRLKSNLFFPD